MITVNQSFHWLMLLELQPLKNRISVSMHVTCDVIKCRLTFTVCIKSNLLYCSMNDSASHLLGVFVFFDILLNRLMHGHRYTCTNKKKRKLYHSSAYRNSHIFRSKNIFPSRLNNKILFAKYFSTFLFITFGV